MRNMESVEVTLPVGFPVENEWYQTANLRLLYGKDKCEFVENAEFLLPAERITALLTHCLTKLGPKSSVNFKDVRSLVAGDRDALFLHLRCLMYGERIQSVIKCPEADCEEKMNLEFNVNDILVPPNKKTKEIYERNIDANGCRYKVKFRLPTGADQEAVARLAQHDSKTASKLLLKRCIKDVKKNGSKIKLENRLPVALVKSLSKRMSELDPQAEVLLDLTCPACKQKFFANFDIGDYFFKELIADSHQLYGEVHVLALYYHWNEKDILKLTNSKRRMYLRFLADTLNTEGS